jgi:hypothetical protein
VSIALQRCKWELQSGANASISTSICTSLDLIPLCSKLLTFKLSPKSYTYLSLIGFEKKRVGICRKLALQVDKIVL